MRMEPSDSRVLTVTTSAIIGPSRPCIIQGVSIAPGSGASSVSLYEPALDGALTTVGATLKVVVTGPANGATCAHPCSASGIVFNKGCIAVVAGTGAQATVTYAVI